MNEPEHEINRRQFVQHAAITSLGITALASDEIAAQEKPAAELSPPPDIPQAPPPAKCDLGSLFPTVAELAKRPDDPILYPASFLKRPSDSLDVFKVRARGKVYECFGYRPQLVDHRPEVLSRQEFPEFIREKIVFSTTAQMRVPAYVHIPKGLKGPAPAIIDLHSHGGMFLFGKEKVIDFGENHPTMKLYHERNYGGRPTATALVKRGYVVITIDAFMFGERRVRLAEDEALGLDRAKLSPEQIGELNRKCRGKESTLAKSLIYAGTSWPAIMYWDDLRTLDYLCTRPEVDAKRIGCLGVSLGGWRSIFLAGLSTRLAAACIVGFMSTVQPMLERHIDTHSFAHFVPGLHQWLDLPDVASLLAPNPLLVLQCKQDGLFPLAGMEESVEKISAVYNKAGVKNHFTSKFYDVPHEFNVAMQDDAFAWFDEQLK